MVRKVKSIGALVLRLIVGLALLGWSQIGSAAGTWSVIATGGPAPGQVSRPTAIAVDTTGSLYVADYPAPDNRGRLQKRDAQGNWSLVASAGTKTGQVNYIRALAVDADSNLYVAEDARIQTRTDQGGWSVIATLGTGLGQ